MLGVALVALFCIIEATGQYHEEPVKSIDQSKAKDQAPLRLSRRLAERLSLPKAG